MHDSNVQISLFVSDFTSNHKSILNECNPLEIASSSKITTMSNNKRKTNVFDEDIIDGKVYYIK